jgi:hypothetical protein
MNILSQLFRASSSRRSETPRFKPQLETLGDRSLPSGLSLSMAPMVGTAKMPTLSPPLERFLAQKSESGASRAAQPRQAQEGERIVVQGTLHTGIFAIGGETTGFIIETADGRTYELQLNRAQQAWAMRHDGQQIEVTGRLTIVPGVEGPDRQVIIVDKMRAVR